MARPRSKKTTEGAATVAPVNIAPPSRLSRLVSAPEVDFDALKKRPAVAGDSYDRNRAYDIPPFCDQSIAAFRFSAFVGQHLTDMLMPAINTNQPFPWAICNRANEGDWASGNTVPDEVYNDDGAVQTAPDQILLYRPMWLEERYWASKRRSDEKRAEGPMKARVGQKVGEGEMYAASGEGGVVQVVDPDAATTELPPDYQAQRPAVLGGSSQ